MCETTLFLKFNNCSGKCSVVWAVWPCLLRTINTKDLQNTNNRTPSYFLFETTPSVLCIPILLSDSMLDA